MPTTASFPRSASPSLSWVILLSLAVSIISVTFSIAVSSIGLTLAVLAFLLKAAHDRKWEIKHTPLDYFFLAYVIVETLSTIFATEKAQSLANAKRLFLIAIVYLVATYVTSGKKALGLVGVLAIVAALLSIVELLEYFKLRPERLFLFQHYMTAGGIKMIILLLVLPFLLHEGTPRKFRVIGVLAFIPTLLALLLTFTRSSWLGLVGGGMVVGALKYRIVIPILVVCMIVFLLFAPAPLRERAYSIVSLSHEHNVGRVHMWKTGIQILKDYPILGVGDIDLQHLYARYKSADDLEPGGHLHNNILMWLVTLGFLGCAILISLFARILVFQFKTVKQTTDQWLAGSLALGAVAASVGFHINGLFEWNFGDQEIMVLMWTSVGLALVANRVSLGMGTGGAL